MKQDNLALFGGLSVTPELKLVETSELLNCGEEVEIYQKMVSLARDSKGVRKAPMAVRIDSKIGESQFSRVLNGSQNLPRQKQNEFRSACGNAFDIQWHAFQLGYELVPRQITMEEKALLFDQQQGQA